MPESAEISAKKLRCPRCGYDLRGTALCWEHVCPLLGRCPECGLTFPWGAIFTSRIHPFLFEHHWRDRPFDSLFRTTAALLRPGRFWKVLSLFHPVRLIPLHLMLLLFMSAALLVFLFSIVELSAWRHLTDFTGSTTMMQQLRIDYSVGWRIMKHHLRERQAIVYAVLLLPAAFLLMPVTLRSSLVRFIHIVRIQVYFVATCFLIVMLWIHVFTLLYIFHDLWMFPDIFQNGAAWLNVRFSPWSLRAFTSLSEMSSIGSLKLMIFLQPLAMIWWYLACRYYLQLRRSYAVAILLPVLTGLLAILLQLHFADGWLTYW